MQPIIMIGAAVVAVALLGTGFLGEPWNNIDLWIQELGWGERNLEAPISHAYIDLEIKKVLNTNDTPNDKSDDFYNNIIRACSFHSDTSLDAFNFAEDKNGNVLGLAPAKIICKLTNEKGLAIAEGQQVLNGVQPDSEKNKDDCDQRDKVQNGYIGSKTIRIDICQTSFDFSNEVQEVHDLKLIVENALNRMVPTLPAPPAPTCEDMGMVPDPMGGCMEGNTNG